MGTRRLLDTSALGLERGLVRMVPSDPSWPVAFHQLAAEMLPALPETVVAVEHVGSTSIPGLSAKPILDIAIGIRAGADPTSASTVVEHLGFLYRGDADGDQLDRMFGLEYEPRIRLVNAHMVTYNSPEWREYVNFRDRLRADVAAREEYQALKLELAGLHTADRHSYIAGKTGFISDVLQAREDEDS